MCVCSSTSLLLCQGHATLTKKQAAYNPTLNPKPNDQKAQLALSAIPYTVEDGCADICYGKIDASRADKEYAHPHPARHTPSTANPPPHPAHAALSTPYPVDAPCLHNSQPTYLTNASESLGTGTPAPGPTISSE
ncbi:hypothetical protein LshimejAT787_1300420 [Lyophyllum shimeji]|uniref:Uncharacterized protein n=1 Tax=Lyophyllum shimeji TaxID=47721 RepID=A0A9P3PXT4_LYOSH|nr:hypothetical protein LshimejAT787_1300420 [Lyophyllum shimeji]